MSPQHVGGRTLRARLAPGALVVAASILIAALRVAPPRARAATPNETPNGATAVVALDPQRVAAFLAAVRGTGPVACELAARAVDGGGGWFSRDAGEGASMADSAVRSLVASVVESGDDGRESTDDAAVVAPLRDALGDADPCVRRLAAPLLGRVDHASAVAALRDVLRGPSATARQAAAIGLGFTGKQRASDARASLVTALGDADASVRRSSAWALGRLELPGTATPVAALLRDRDTGVRRAAAYALGAMEDVASVPALVTALRDDADAGVRQAAAWALGQIK